MGATGMAMPPDSYARDALIDERRQASREAYEAGARDALELGETPRYPGSLFGGTPKKAKHAKAKKKKG